MIANARVFILYLAGMVQAISANGSFAEMYRLNLTQYPAARCLDGSPGAFYWRPASKANSSNWVIYFEGGGECVTEASCLQRTHTQLGTTKRRPSFWTLSNVIQSAKAEENPDFSSWNQIYIVYCSGDLHLGTQTEPQTLKGLQFSGHHIVSAILNELHQQHQLSDARNVIVTGGSAGGIAAFAYVDYVRDMLSSSVAVIGAPVGGYYFSNNWTYTGVQPPPNRFIPWTYKDMEYYYSLWNAFVPRRCAASLVATPWICIFAHASYPTLSSPVFVAEGQTDKVVMPLHDGLPQLWMQDQKLCLQSVHGCPAPVVEYMRSWRDHMADSIKQVVDSSRGDGLYHPACLVHTEFEASHPIVHGFAYLEAFGSWLFKRDTKMNWVDDCGEVLCNPTCNAVLVGEDERLTFV